MLAFTREVFFSNFAVYNAAVWPAHLLALALVALTLFLLWRPAAQGGRIISGVLVAFWLWTGIAYHWFAFATINFLAPFLAALFVLEALLLLWAGVARNRLPEGGPGDARLVTGVILVVLGCGVYPLGDWLAGVGPQALRLAGMAPGPTALFTLGALALSGPGWPRYLAVIPMLWLAMADAAAFSLGLPVDAGISGLGIIAAFLLLFARRRNTARAI